MNPRGKLFLVTGVNSLQLLGEITDLKLSASKEAITVMYPVTNTDVIGESVISGPITMTITPDGREVFEDMARRFREEPPELKIKEAEPEPKKISYQQQQRNLPKFLRRGRR